MESQLTKHQEKTFTAPYGDEGRIVVEVRYDDRHGNGHNTFAITGMIYDRHRREGAAGCIHDEIAQAFPHLAHLIKWHLCSSDGPMHYIENACYLASDTKARELDGAREAAIWPEATDEQLSLPRHELRRLLLERLPALLEAFRHDMEAFGFTW